MKDQLTILTRIKEIQYNAPVVVSRIIATTSTCKWNYLQVKLLIWLLPTSKTLPYKERIYIALQANYAI